MTPTYWQDAAADEAMQEEHGFVWRAMLDTVDVDLAGRRVLDAGARLAVRFVPAAGHHGHDRGRLLDWLDYYYYDQKLLLRFTRP